MSYARRISVTATTDASGDATVYLPSSDGESLTGIVNVIIYTKDDFDNGVDFTITAEASGQTLWTESNVNASKTVYPVAAANLGTGATSSLLEVPIYLANDRIKIVIASGGNAKSGTFTATVA